MLNLFLRYLPNEIGFRTISYCSHFDILNFGTAACSQFLQISLFYKKVMTMRLLLPGLIDHENWFLVETKAIDFICKESKTIYKDGNLQPCTFRFLKKRYGN